MIVDLNKGETTRLRTCCRQAGLTVPETAYLLATACWETAGSLLPVREGFYLGTRAEVWRAGLRYAPFYGRGFVQLTWRANYERAGKVLGMDLCAEPDRALDAVVAARILVRGALEGWFTGRRLGDYFDGGRCDYLGARRIINGTDRAEEIAALADGYEAALAPREDALLRRGMAGAPVQRLQTALRAAGQTLKVDGIFGIRTEAALRAFQQSRALVPDGIAGPASWASLLAVQP